MLKLRKYGHWYFLGLVALAAYTVWQAVFWAEAHRGRVFIHVFDVGQGDAIFIEAPNGNQVLIDGGPDASLLAKLGADLPFWDRSLDLIVLTHPHADHLDGLVEVLTRYEVGLVLESGVSHSIPEYEEWHKLLEAKGVNVVIAKSGQTVGLSQAASLDVLTPFESFVGKSSKNIHDATVALKLVYASTTALLMGDAERPLERQLIGAGTNLDVDVLKVGHHGSKTSTSEEFLRATTPRLAVISVGRKNRYGHPYQEVLDRLERFGVTVLRTDQDGDITIVSDGRALAY